jgi:hypothetical protein
VSFVNEAPSSRAQINKSENLSENEVCSCRIAYSGSTNDENHDKNVAFLPKIFKQDFKK